TSAVRIGARVVRLIILQTSGRLTNTIRICSIMETVAFLQNPPPMVNLCLGWRIRFPQNAARLKPLCSWEVVQTPELPCGNRIPFLRALETCCFGCVWRNRTRHYNDSEFGLTELIASSAFVAMS